ncbi:HAUS augmin-like complex subunit isoform X2 [Tasmannia lanceolata]|uniref:HAUS augmin-like complex subunit isoform X2 n=1 Tax=Tasmannia lanceolata TaxID=3420 RepID=UPI0040634FBD
MQSSGSSVPHPEAILEWLQKEMGYRPQNPYLSANNSLPSIETLRKICRGNMVPVWKFLLQRVKSEKTVEKIRRNIHVHGSNDGISDAVVKDETKISKGKRKEKDKVKLGLGFEKGLGVEGSSESREIALRERELAEKEVERLRHVVQRQRRDLRAKMLEASREEMERKRMLDERSNYRHKQAMLEAYFQQCNEAAKIFAEYQKRLHYYVSQARDAQRSSSGVSFDVVDDFHANSEKEAVYSTVKGNRSSDDVILIETTRERNIRKACETLAAHMIEKIRNTFPAYEGTGIHVDPQLEAAKLGIDFDGEMPDDVKAAALNALRNPPQLLQAVTAYTSRVKTLIHREAEKIDIRADAELLRYKYENNRVTDAASPDVNSNLPYQVYGNGKIGIDVSTKGTHKQLLERQKAHVQQFVATEDALNKAAEARNLSQKLIKRLHGSSDGVSSNSLPASTTSENLGTLRHFELDVLAKEREAAGLRASLNTLTSEVQRLNKLCAEWKEAEDSLRKKWKKIEEFDARRSELESIYTALLRANMDAAVFWDQQQLAAREYASSTIIPACGVVVDISTSAKDLIEKEVSAFSQSPDNSLYMLPSTPQALLESMGANGSSGPEAVAAAEKNAALLTARAGARDPSAIPSICRVSAALQYHADAGLASVLESLEFCLKLRGSEASILEELSKAINLVHIRQDLVESGHALLNHAYRAQQEYDRTTSYCLKLAVEQEKEVMEKWLPELKSGVLNAQKCLEDCKRVRGLVDEWWEQPAATAVDWVTVDGQNVAAWLNHVKQLQMVFYDKELL